MDQFKVAIDKIIVTDRGRKDFGDLAELALSIQQFGLINPILVELLPDNAVRLIAGECRLRACKNLGWKEIPATTRESLSALEHKSIELEENIRRKALTWQEEIFLKDQLDKIKREQFGAAIRGGDKHSLKETWGLMQTSAILGQSPANVSKDLKLAKAMQENPQLALELAKYPKTVAYSKLMHMKKAEDARRNVTSDTIIDIDLRLGPCEDGILNVADASVDLIVTDPPFAVDKIATSKGNYSDMLTDSDNSDAITLVRCLDKLLPQLFRVLKDGSHMYIFYGPEWFCKLREMITAVGFEVDPVPLIWDKGRTTTPCRGYNYAQCYEPILFCRKPPRELRLLNKNSANILGFPPVKTKEHPFHKSPELIQFLISQSSHPGELVLDPFAGSGETLLSAKKLSRRGLGFELNEDNYYRAMAYVSGDVKNVTEAKLI